MYLLKDDLTRVQNLSFFMILALSFPFSAQSVSYENKSEKPTFTSILTNQTAIKGRDVTFTCMVKQLGQFKVAWIKSDTKAIQAIHHHVVTHNPRVSISHDKQSVWQLLLSGVRESDRGYYMCQVNTDPMMSQEAFLEVLVPPDILQAKTLDEVVLNEGESSTFVCEASGYPSPVIKWDKEYRNDIGSSPHYLGGSRTDYIHEGATLTIQRAGRKDMGTYLCIASNGIPPAVSKRFTLLVHFSPSISVPVQHFTAESGSNVTLECVVEGFPRPVYHWWKEGREIRSDAKHRVEAIRENAYTDRLRLTAFQIDGGDFGEYSCAAKNSLSSSRSSIFLHKLIASSELSKRNNENAYAAQRIHEESAPLLLKNSSGPAAKDLLLLASFALLLATNCLANFRS